MAFSSSPPRPTPPSLPLSPPSSSQSPELGKYGQSSALTTVQALLRQLLRVSTTDGRVFIGTFAGTDKPLNIILVNTEEFRVGPGQNADGRYVGQVVLPWKVVVKVEAHIAEKPGREASSAAMYMWWVLPRMPHHAPAERFSDPLSWNNTPQHRHTISYLPIHRFSENAAHC